MTSQPAHDLTIGSLFSSVGMLDLAVELVLGGRLLWQCELDPWRRRVLERHWPGVARHADVCELRTPPPVDLIVGGFPCQDVSLAGLGAGLDGARSGLWGEYARIIGEIRPAFALIENVRGLERRGLDRVLDDLDARGYQTRRGRLAASDVGAPHRRERIWILAYTDPRGLRQLAERIERVAAVRRHALDLDQGPRGHMANAHEIGRQGPSLGRETAHAWIGDGLADHGRPSCALADTDRGGRGPGCEPGPAAPRRVERPEPDRGGQTLADATTVGCGPGQRQDAKQRVEQGRPATEPDHGDQAVADPDDNGRGGRGGRGEAYDYHRGDALGDDDARCRARALLSDPDWPPGPGSPDWAAWLARNPGCEPGIRRAPHGRARGLDDRRPRLAALGDGVCVHQACAAIVALVTGEAEPTQAELFG